MSSLPEPRGLIFDLEVVPPKSGQLARIMMVGALRPDSGAALELKVAGNPSPALQQLDALAEGASFVLGHNVIDHDLP
ncbi:hypothetical protein, partial [Pseudomonas aeruginosa]